MEETASSLKKAGAEEIYGVVVARGRNVIKKEDLEERLLQ